MEQMMSYNLLRYSSTNDEENRIEKIFMAMQFSFEYCIDTAELNHQDYVLTGWLLSPKKEKM